MPVEAATIQSTVSVAVWKSSPPGSGSSAAHIKDYHWYLGFLLVFSKGHVILLCLFPWFPAVLVSSVTCILFIAMGWIGTFQGGGGWVFMRIKWRVFGEELLWATSFFLWPYGFCIVVSCNVGDCCEVRFVHDKQSFVVCHSVALTCL